MNFTLKKEERLCSRKDIETLILKGNKSFLYPLKIYWNIAFNQNVRVKIAFAVPKKNIKRANKRNLIKRRMREAYRLQKPYFVERIEVLNLQLHLLLVYVSAQVMNYKELEVIIKKILDTIYEEIQNTAK